MAETQESKVTYEDLAAIEDELQDIETEALRQQWISSSEIYKRRAGITSKIPHFWSKVIQGAPQSIDDHLKVEDMPLLEDHVTDISVSRFELDSDPKNGDPRSFSIKFTFSPNEYIEDATLEKRFHYRAIDDGWRGHCSEPVKINWKPGKDLTDGLTDAAVKWWAAWQEKLAMDPKALQDSVPEYEEVGKKFDEVDNESFFRFFGFSSSRRYVSAEESAEAMAKEKMRRQRFKEGKSTDDDGSKGQDAEQDDSLQGAEIMSEAEDIAAGIADDMFPNAIKYFTQAEEFANMIDEDDFEDLMDEDDEDEDDDEEKPVDIRKLVGKGKVESPPSKKRKT